MQPYDPFQQQPMVSPDFYQMGMQNIQQQNQQMMDLDISKIPKIIEPKQADVNVFSNYHEKLNSQPQKPVETVEINIMNNIDINEEALLEALRDYKSMSDTNLRNLLYSHFKFLLQKIFNGQGDNRYSSLVGIFTDTRVLQILGEIIYRVPISQEERVYCNNMVYSYLAYSKTTTDCEATIIAMGTFASIVNRDKIPKLVEFGYDEKTAAHIAMVSQSSMDKIRNVKRLNKVIVNLPENLVTEDLITATYYTVFTSATAIMEGIMFDVQDYSKMSELQKENYSLINLALLSILDNMDDSKLMTILLNYSQDRMMLYPDKVVRFNLRCFVAEDYPRLDYTIKRLDIANGNPLIF